MSVKIDYFVRVVEGRPCDLPSYIKRIEDKEHKYVKSYINALYDINDYNAVLLEDDVVLCNNFQEEIQKVVDQYPNTIINFFSNPSKYYTTHYTDIFAYNQCTYFPKDMTKLLADEMMEMYLDETYYAGRQRYGSLLSSVLYKLGIPHLVYRPTLVQHIDAISSRDGIKNNRNTPYFKDYLDRLGIDMVQARENDNLEKLKLMLEIDRKKWYENI